MIVTKWQEAKQNSIRAGSFYSRVDGTLLLKIAKVHIARAHSLCDKNVRTSRRVKIIWRRGVISAFGSIASKITPRGRL